MIYETHFSLTQRPFTIAPNPFFLYANGQYQEALAALEYGLLHRGGFVLLTGEVGTGKTTLCKHLLANVPSNTEVALVLHPQLDRLEMLQLICREFKITCASTDSEVHLIERLTEFLLDVYSTGGYSVLIVDEAQHLDSQVLELIRLLTNLETHEDKLLQIILLGQPELKARLQQYDMRQLNQRFTARYHLNALNYAQLGKYVNHRLSVAGSSQHLFSASALFMLYKLSGGIPRLINIIADRSLMGGYALGKIQIGPLIVYRAAKEVLPSPPSFSVKPILFFALVMLAIVMLA
ncbi:MAG: general secretion pathway protein A, partial [Crocinitomicaceae bacterium]